MTVRQLDIKSLFTRNALFACWYGLSKTRRQPLIYGHRLPEELRIYDYRKKVFCSFVSANESGTVRRNKSTLHEHTDAPSQTDFPLLTEDLATKTLPDMVRAPFAVKEAAWQYRRFHVQLLCSTEKVKWIFMIRRRPAQKNI